MRWVNLFIRIVDNLNDRVGSVIGVLILPMVLILVWEVLMRYGFNRPTMWAHETSEFLYGAHFIIGGAYAMRWRAHVNVEIIYNRFPPRMRAVVDLLTWLLFYFFCGILLWKGGQAAWKSVAMLETSYSAWAPPVWPIKLTIPLAAALVLLQGLTKTIGDVYLVITGRGLIVEVARKEGL